MKFNYHDFSDESDLNNHLEENHNFTVDLSRGSYSSHFQILETDQSIIVGHLSVDSDAQDFFENDDGAGKFIEFRSPEQRDQKLNELGKTKKLFYLVDKYDHSSVHYSVSETNNYPDKQWDMSPGKAVLIPCDDIQSQYKKLKKEKGDAVAFKEFIKDSNSVLDEYSKWCNGEVYGYEVKVFNKKGKELSDESCWGFIGDDYANKEKQSTMEHFAMKEIVSKLAENVEIKTLTAQDLKELPFKVLKKGFVEGKTATVYDKTMVAIKYAEEDKASFYEWSVGQEKPSVNKFDVSLRKYGTTPEKFLDANLTSSINSTITNKLKEEENTKTKKVSI